MKRTFYEKVGKRYRPVQEYDSALMSSFPRGAHLIISEPGSRSVRYNIDPNHAALIAASQTARDHMLGAMISAQNPKELPSWTPEQRAAWMAFAQTMHGGWVIHSASASDVVDAGLKALEHEAADLMKHPAVRDAFDRFVTVCKLVRDQPKTDSE